LASDLTTGVSDADRNGTAQPLLVLHTGQPEHDEDREHGGRDVDDVGKLCLDDAVPDLVGRVGAVERAEVVPAGEEGDEPECPPGVDRPVRPAGISPAGSPAS
jgi:hypothetical protein